jgi:serine protease AprX
MRTLALPANQGITWDVKARLCVLAALGAVFASFPPTMAAVSKVTGGVISVIIQAAPGTSPQVSHEVTSVGGRVTHELNAIDAVTADVPASTVPALVATPAVVRVTRNAPVHLLSSTYDPTTDTGSAYNTTLLTGAQAMWSAGYTGKGVDVAVIDSGINPVEGLSTAGKLINGPDLSFDSQATNLRYLDAFGHGTFMAGIIAGRDTAAVSGHYAGDSADFLGVAPDARILSVKVADSHGYTDVSQVLAAISWVVQHRHDIGMNVRVLNLALGSDSSQSEILDPLSFAAEHAWKRGIVVVAAAGNAGWKTNGLLDPAYNPFLIATGAADTQGTNTTSDDTVATFSNHGDGVRNPDLVAPGKSMQSLRVPNSYIDATYGSTGQISDRFFRGSGTSEATAVVSGAAALLLQQRPNASPDQIKAILTSTATWLAGQPAAAQGHGELNLAAAFRTPTPWLATQLWLPATGLGSVEQSRGTVHLTMAGVNLTGEMDIFGAPLNSSNLATAILNDAAWNGGMFNGNTWTGNTWTGNTWTGTTWTGNTWTGTTWTGNTWTGNTWTGTTWTGNTWTGNTWTGNTWTGNTWTSASWS